MRTFLSTLLLFIISCSHSSDEVQVVNTLKNASELATTEFVITKIISSTKSNKVLGIRITADATFMANSEASVKTGIDLKEFGAKDIKIKGKRIEIQLPEVKILHFSYPPNKIEVIKKFSRRNYFNSFTIEERDALYREAEATIRQNLHAYGITETTENNTRKLFTHLLKKLGFKDIEISFRKSSS